MQKYLKIMALDGHMARNEMDARLWTISGIVNEVDGQAAIGSAGTYVEQWPRTMPLATAIELTRTNALRAFGDLYGRDVPFAYDGISVTAGSVLK